MTTTRFLVTWEETRAGRTAQVFYQGWWHAYGEPLWSCDPKNGLKMSCSGARKVVKRLSDPAIWGGVKAKVIRAETI